MGGDARGPGWVFFAAAALVIATVAVAVTVHVLISGFSGRKSLGSKRLLTLRIDEIPVDKPRDVLESDVSTIVDRDSVLKGDDLTVLHHHLVRRNEKLACATATFRTSVSQGELVKRLNSASFGLPYRFDVKFHGITPIYEPLNTTAVDVVAVPGLGSHAIGSWKSPSSNDVWLRDYLPDDIQDIRILVYGYDTSLMGSDSKDSIEDLGIRFLESIKAFRRGSETRPIVFIGHSLGGLLIKEALVHAQRKADNQQNHLFFKSCYGLLFFGVPNLGLRNEQLRSIVQGQPNDRLIRDLVVDDDSEPSPFLKRLSDQFSECCRGQYKVVSFFERRLSPTVQIRPDGTLAKTGDKIFMVTEKSATATGLTAAAEESNISLNADHSGLVKYESRVQDEYSIVKERLRNLVDEAASEVPKRFPEGQAIVNGKQDFISSIMSHIKEINKCALFKDGSSCTVDITRFTHTSGFSHWVEKPHGILWLSSDEVDGTSPLLAAATSYKTHWPGLKILYHNCPSVKKEFVKTDETTEASREHKSSSIVSDLIGQCILLEARRHEDMEGLENTLSLYGLDMQAVLTAVASPKAPIDAGFEELRKLLVTPTGESRGFQLVINNLGLVDDEEVLQLSHRLKTLGSVLPILLGGLRTTVMMKYFQGVLEVGENTEYEECLLSLDFDEIHLRRDLVASAQSGTNEWIFKNPKFLKWRHGTPSLLWIDGKPGSGKSVLAKSLVTHIKQNMELDGGTGDCKTLRKLIIVDWFYSRRDGPITMAHVSMMRSIISQILKDHPPAFERAREIYRTKKPYTKEQSCIWSAADLETLFSKVLQSSLPVVCILDGLDESEDGEKGSRTRETIINVMKSLTSPVSDCLCKFIVLSRPTKDIKQTLLTHHTSSPHAVGDIHHITMQEENELDIRNIVDAGITSIEGILQSFSSADSAATDYGVMSRQFESLKAQERAALKNARLYLLENSNGVILWVTLILQTMEKRCRSGGVTAQELAEVLVALPKDLVELYKYIAQDLEDRLPPQKLKKTRDVLMWVTGASVIRTLTLEELWEALALPPDIQEAIDDRRDYMDVHGIPINDWEGFKAILLEWCGVFIEVIDPRPRTSKEDYTGGVDPSYVVQLTHQTVKDFLANNDVAGSFYFSEAEAREFVKSSGDFYVAIVCGRFRRLFNPKVPIALENPEPPLQAISNYLSLPPKAEEETEEEQEEEKKEEEHALGFTFSEENEPTEPRPVSESPKLSFTAVNEFEEEWPMKEAKEKEKKKRKKRLPHIGPSKDETSATPEPGANAEQTSSTGSTEEIGWGNSIGVISNADSKSESEPHPRPHLALTERRVPPPELMSVKITKKLEIEVGYLMNRCLFKFFLADGPYSTLESPAVWGLRSLLLEGSSTDTSHTNWIHGLFRAACFVGGYLTVEILLKLSTTDDTWWQRNRAAVLDAAIATAAEMDWSLVFWLIHSWGNDVSLNVRCHRGELAYQRRRQMDYNDLLYESQMDLYRKSLLLAPAADRKAKPSLKSDMPGPAKSKESDGDLLVAVASQKYRKQLDELQDHRGPRSWWVRNMMLRAEVKLKESWRVRLARERQKIKLEKKRLMERIFCAHGSEQAWRQQRLEIMEGCEEDAERCINIIDDHWKQQSRTYYSPRPQGRAYVRPDDWERPQHGTFARPDGYAHLPPPAAPQKPPSPSITLERLALGRNQVISQRLGANRLPQLVQPTKSEKKAAEDEGQPHF